MNRLKPLQPLFLTAIFITAISLPLLIMVFSEDETISHTEKRMLVKRPKIPSSVESFDEFPSRYEAYFNDHFGLRDSLVKLYNFLFVSIFQTSPRFDIVVGKEKWLFYISDYIINDFMGQTPLKSMYVQRWAQILKDRKEWLADQGIKYLFVPAPNKMTIYPEYLPHRFQVRMGQANLNQFLQYLNEQPKFSDIVDLQKELLAAKRHDQLYYKADTHWNYDGAFAAYVAIINHIKHWFPGMEPIEKKEMVRENKIFVGDLAHMLNLASIYKQGISVLKVPNVAQKISSVSLEAYKKSYKIYHNDTKDFLYVNKFAPQDLTAVFISDSFGDQLIDFLTQNFSRVLFIQTVRFEAVTDFLVKEKPDIVLDLRVARGIGDALRQNSEVRNYNVKKNALDGNPLLDISGGNLNEKIADSHQIEVVDSSTHSIFVAKGKDPQLSFNFTSEKSKSPLGIYCQLASPGDTLLKLYYQTPGHPYYSENKTVVSKLTKGDNTIYHRIYEPVLLAKLRLDPGTLPGRYDIKRLVIAEEQ